MTINRENTLNDWDPGVRPKIEALNKQFPTVPWGTYGGHDPTKGRATDAMIPGYQTAAGKALGKKIADWAWANRERLGIHYVIWNARIISQTRPAAGWRTYYPTSAAIRSSRDSAYHYNHVHISFYQLSAPPTPQKFLPPYVVDPEQISTFMVANATRAGTDDKLRKPLFRVTTGTEIVTRTAADGKVTKWLVTESGYEYYLPFLVLESEYKKRPPRTETPQEPTLTTVRVASYNILSDAAGIKDGGGPLAKRLPAIVKSLRDSKASVYLLQECNKDASALVQGELGADWMWIRVGTRTVMWDKTVWEFKEDREVTLPKPHVDVDKTFPLVLLSHIKGGDPVWFCSVHFVSSAGNDASSKEIDAQRKASAEKLVEVFAGLTRAVGGGDLNTYSMSKGKAKPVLLAGGLKLLTQDGAFDSAGVDSFENSTKGGQQIDEVWGKGFRFLDGDIIQGTGSDHNLLVAEIEIEK